MPKQTKSGSSTSSRKRSKGKSNKSSKKTTAIVMNKSETDEKARYLKGWLLAIEKLPKGGEGYLNVRDNLEAFFYDNNLEVITSVIDKLTTKETTVLINLPFIITDDDMEDYAFQYVNSKWNSRRFIDSQLLQYEIVFSIMKASGKAGSTDKQVKAWNEWLNQYSLEFIPARKLKGKDYHHFGGNTIRQIHSKNIISEN